MIFFRGVFFFVINFDWIITRAKIENYRKSIRDVREIFALFVRAGSLAAPRSTFHRIRLRSMRVMHTRYARIRSNLRQKLCNDTTPPFCSRDARTRAEGAAWCFDREKYGVVSLARKVTLHRSKRLQRLSSKSRDEKLLKNVSKVSWNTEIYLFIYLLNEGNLLRKEKVHKKKNNKDREK